MRSHESRLERLEAAERAEMDIDALGAALGFSTAQVAEAKRWAASLPPGTTGLDAARLVGEELGIDPGDILAEAELIMGALG